VNAPATFQRLMEYLFADMRWNGVLVYLDDILVHGQSFEEVLEKLRTVLQRLSTAGLTLNLQKCDFFPKLMRYLGHLITEGSLLPDPQKVAALDRIQVPSNIKEVRSLLGFFGYYRQFIPKYAEIALPITQLLKKCQKFIWGPAQEAAVAKLKSSLVSIALHNPLDGDNFLLTTDASDVAVGAILSCKKKDSSTWRPVEFASKTLSDTARRWPVHEREAFAIVWALGKFDQYLRGREFVIHTDNSSLQWMDKASVGKIARWASRMAEYKAEIQHKSGKVMEHVDFLSRYIDPEEKGLEDRMLYTLSISDNFPSFEEVHKAQKAGFTPFGRGYTRANDILFYRGKVWVPSTLRPRIITASHDCRPYLHPGQRKTISTIQKVFGWRGIHEDVGKYLSSCLICQRTKPGIEKLQGLMLNHPLEGIFEKLHIDMWECTFRGQHLRLLTMIDHTTKWAECAILPNKTAESVASHLLNYWICRFGVPRIIITDQDPTFISSIFTTLCQKLGCKVLRSTVYHPQGNSPVETFHRTLSIGFSVFQQQVRTTTLTIEEILCLILYSYRSTIHLGIGDTPAFMTYGVDPRPPADRDWRFTRLTNEKERLHFLSLARLEMMTRAQLRAQQVLNRENMGRIDVSFTQGDLVLVRLQRRELVKLARLEGSEKVIPKWSIPHRVLRVSPNGKTAYVRNCLGDYNEVKQVHIKDVRFISTPMCPEQKLIWDDTIRMEFSKSAFDEKTRARLLKEFWERIDLPQQENLKKRPRISSTQTFGGDDDMILDKSSA